MRAHARQYEAFADGTNRNHISNLRLFLSFAVFYSLPAWPAPLDTLLLFVEYLTLSYNAPKAVTNVIASIKLQHERAGLSLLQFQHIRLRLALRSLHRTMRAAPSPAPPFPAGLLQPLTQAAASLGEWATPFKALILLAFFTFARLGSLLPVKSSGFDTSRHPTVADLVLVGRGGELRLKFSKTRQAAHEGFLVPFFRTVSLPCLVGAAGELLHRARRMALGPSAPLFAAGGPKGTPPCSLTQTQARGFLRACLNVLGLPTNAFSFHSFRRGGGGGGVLFCLHAGRLGVRLGLARGLDERRHQGLLSGHPGQGSSGGPLGRGPLLLILTLLPRLLTQTVCRGESGAQPRLGHLIKRCSKFYTAGLGTTLT